MARDHGTEEPHRAVMNSSRFNPERNGPLGGARDWDKSPSFRPCSRTEHHQSSPDPDSVCHPAKTWLSSIPPVLEPSALVSAAPS